MSTQRADFSGDFPAHRRSQNGRYPVVKPLGGGPAKIFNKPLTSPQRGLALNYHLRSNSGSNGPIAKECHRFLVAGPFKFLVGPAKKTCLDPPFSARTFGPAP